MPRHFEDAPGLYTGTNTTAGYFLNHTMLRIKDPLRSLDFYSRCLGMQLVRRLDFPEMSFTLYFLGFIDEASEKGVPTEDADARTTWTFDHPGLLELTHNWGSEVDPEVQYHNGNDQPQGYGHIGVTVPDVHAACDRLRELDVDFVKDVDDGRMKGLAFIRDPDGYWIEVIQADMMERQNKGLV